MENIYFISLEFFIFLGVEELLVYAFERDGRGDILQMRMQNYKKNNKIIF